VLFAHQAWTITVVALLTSFSIIGTVVLILILFSDFFMLWSKLSSSMPQCRIKNFKKLSVIQFLRRTQASRPLIAASFFASFEHHRNLETIQR
jgi:hypothetical protein